MEENNNKAGGYRLRFSAKMGTKEKSVTFPVPAGMLEHMRALVEEQRETGEVKYEVRGHRSMMVEVSLLSFDKQF